MKGVALIATGIAVDLVALWGGSWIYHQVQFGDWWEFPTLATVLAMIVLGSLCLARGAMLLGESNP